MTESTLSSKSSQPVALVTGAAGIIGPSICAVLSEAGWCVVASDRTKDAFELYEITQGRPVRAHAIVPADLSSRDGCTRLVAEAEAAAGSLGLIVNVATAHDRRGAFDQTDPEFCQRLLNVDLLAPLFLAQAAANSLAENRGTVLILSSIHVAMTLPTSPFYRVVKAAVEKLAETLAVELGPRGVRANAIRVGWIPGTDFLRPTLRKLPPHRARQLYEEVLPPYLAEQRAQGAGTPEDIAYLVEFLASPRARLIQGATIPADGGLPSAMRPHPCEKSAFSAWLKHPEASLELWLERIAHEDP